MNWILFPVGLYATTIDLIEGHGHSTFWLWLASLVAVWVWL